MICGFRHCLMICLLILSFVPPGETAVQLVHYTASGHGATWHESLEFMARRFEADTGISVDVMVSPGGRDPQRAKILTMIAGGTPPDVSDVSPTTGAPLLAQGIFADLSPYVQRDKFPIDQLPPIASESITTPDGRLWFIPLTVYPVVTFFNVDLFAQSGLTNPRELGDAWTWESLTASAKRLTRDTDGDGTPDIYGAVTMTSRWEMQVHQAGAQLYDRLVFPTKSQFNSPGVLKAVEFLQGLYVDRVAIDSSSWRVYKGNAGFTVVDGPGHIGLNYQGLPFQWDIARQPRGPQSRTAKVTLDGFQVISHSNHLEEAWQWVSYLTANAENQLELARFTGRLPSLREAMIRYPGTIGHSLTLPDNWAAMVETALDPGGYMAYIVPNATPIDAVVNPIMSRIWSGQQAAAIGLNQIHDLLPALLR